MADTWIARPGREPGTIVAHCATCRALLHKSADAPTQEVLDAAYLAHPHPCPRVDSRPHSRACGIRCPGHGIGCARDCPTCGEAADG